MEILVLPLPQRITVVRPRYQRQRSASAPEQFAQSRARRAHAPWLSLIDGEA